MGFTHLQVRVDDCLEEDNSTSELRGIWWIGKVLRTSQNALPRRTRPASIQEVRLHRYLGLTIICFAQRGLTSDSDSAFPKGGLEPSFLVYKRFLIVRLKSQRQLLTPLIAGGFLHPQSANFSHHLLHPGQETMPPPSTEFPGLYMSPSPRKGLGFPFETPHILHPNKTDPQF